MNRTVSISEAADLLGCSVKTVRRLIREGRLEAFKYGDATSRVYVSQGSVELLLEASRVSEPAPDAGDLIAETAA